MMLKGKISPFAHRSGRADQVRRLFENVERIEAQRAASTRKPAPEEHAPAAGGKE